MCPPASTPTNGQVEGAAIRADVTLTVGAPKRGLLQAAQWWAVWKSRRMSG